MERAKRQASVVARVRYRQLDITTARALGGRQGVAGGGCGPRSSARTLTRFLRRDEFRTLPESDERQAETTWNIHTFEGRRSTIDVELGALQAAANWTKTLIHGGRDDVRIEARGIGHRVWLDGAGGFVETF